ncbi:MAG: hypothetical protein D6815_01225 [Candidatus Dadabacteria bacterium]|nr:MAG: hypothetical protein D6815_01225 [Candidatus Dadabacteria bacterium]
MTKNSLKDEILVRTLAVTDSLFAPLRDVDWRTSLPGQVWHQRQVFQSYGVRMSPGTGTQASERKRIERAIAGLADDGLVEKRLLGQRVHLRLTLSGEARARRLAWLPSLREVTELAATICEDYPRGVCERWLLQRIFGSTFTVTERVWLDATVTAAAVHGWLGHASTIRGVAVYYPGTVVPPDPDDLPAEPQLQREANLEKLYGDTFRQHRREMRDAPYDGELGAVPIPESTAYQYGAPTDFEKEEEHG